MAFAILDPLSSFPYAMAYPARARVAEVECVRMKEFRENLGRVAGVERV